MYKLWPVYFAMLWCYSCSPEPDISYTSYGRKISPYTYKHILVITLDEKKDDTVHEKLEVALVKRLNTAGYESVSCMQRYGKSFLPQDEKRVIGGFDSTSYGAILTIKIMDAAYMQHYMSWLFPYLPFVNTADHLNDLYLMGGNYDLPHNTDTLSCYLESSFYTVPQNERLCSISCKSDGSLTAGEAAPQYADMVFKSMLQHRILMKTIPFYRNISVL